MITSKTKFTAALIGASGALALAASAQIGTPVLHYGEPSWDTNTANAVVNTGSLGGSGTYYNTTTTAIDANGAGPDDGATGNSVNFTGSAGNLGTGVNTGLTLAAVSGADKSFTMSSWVNLNDQNGDNMVFGSNGVQPIHFGFRGSNAYMGFWANDLDAGGGTAPAVGTWAYLTWVYDGTNGGGLQTIYANGVQIGQRTGTAPGQQGETLTVGTTGGNSGDLNGHLDDVSVYNVAFSGTNDPGTGTAGQTVAALYANAQAVDTVIPEPATFAAILGGAGMLLGLRRRRA